MALPKKMKVPIRIPSIPESGQCCASWRVSVSHQQKSTQLAAVAAAFSVIEETQRSMHWFTPPMATTARAAPVLSQEPEVSHMSCPSSTALQVHLRGAGPEVEPPGLETDNSRIVWCVSSSA